MRYVYEETSLEVFRALRLAHPLKAFSSYSAQRGDYLGGNYDRCMMHTEFGIEGADCPIIRCETEWDKDPNNEHKRLNEKDTFYLCLPIDD